MSYPRHGQEALQAFGAVIEADAEDIASAMFEAIRLDVQSGASESIGADLNEVDDQEQLSCATLQVPQGALPWARLVWRKAFRRKLNELGAAEVLANSARLERFVRGLGCDREDSIARAR